MTQKPFTAPEPRGALCWQNWKGFEESTDPLPSAYMRAEEATLVSDSTFSGGIHEALGPYTVFNLIGGNADGELGERLALRYSLHLAETEPPKSVRGKPNLDSWLGLTLDEEIAALLSLFLAIRVRSGGVTRQFAVESDDPAGLPVAYPRVRPSLEPLRQPPRIPRLARPRAFLGPVPELLLHLPTLTAAQSVALVRAARQYQMAVWVAESDPELAWLQLVSAIEVAATSWRGENVDPVEVLSEVYPQIVKHLGEGDSTAFVARHLQKLIGSTRRFRDFFEEFDPGPPEARCEAHFQIPWSDLRRRLGLVYNYRSARLHSGEPFPPVMNAAPMTFDEGSGPLERPFGIAHSVGNTQWPSDAVPMHLWFFERLVQGALINWYQQSLGAT